MKNTLYHKQALCMKCFQINKEIHCSCIIPELDLYLYCILNMSTDKN